jgi:hypothetical protein
MSEFDIKSHMVRGAIVAKKKKKVSSGLQPIRSSTKVKRNQPCPCGSGLKAKRCCLRKIQMLEAVPPNLRARVIADSILQMPVADEIGEPVHVAPEVDAADCEIEVTSEE